MPTTHDATASQRLKSAPASPRRGLLTVLLGPQPLPLSVGIAVATAFISIETLLVHWFRHTGSANSFGALFLLGVLVISAAGGFGLAVATTLVSALIYFYFISRATGRSSLTAAPARMCRRSRPRCSPG